MVNYDNINEGISKGNISLVKETVNQLLEEGVEPMTIINDGLMVAMNDVGMRFTNGDMFVPEVMMSAKALHSGMEVLKPLLAAGDYASKGKILIGTVRGDLHDIGKNLVASMLEGCGFEVINLGVDVGSEKFIEAVKENKADILCLSALLTTTMNYMKEVIDALQAAGMRDEVKVMVGGAPVTNAFAQQVGADGYSEDASEAVAVARKLVSA